MSILLRLPNSLHAAARTYAERENISLNQFISTAVAEKLSALGTVDLLQERARLGNRKEFLEIMDQVPDVPDEFELAEEPLTVDRVLNKQRDNVRNYVQELMKQIVDSDVVSFATETNGGDLRFRVGNGIFAEFKFFRTLDEIVIRLYFKPGRELGSEYRVFQKTNKQIKYDRRLNVNQSVPTDLIRHIHESREFMRFKR